MRAWPSVFLPDVPSIELPSLQLYDSYQRHISDVSDDQPFTMYVCGITPYDATHLGHAATYLTFDLIHRYLRFRGARVAFIENVTDIDDPLFERANRDRVDWRALGQSQVDLFRSDMTTLRILPPDSLISVSEAMDEIISFIELLIAKGQTYPLGDDLYLDASLVTDFEDLPWRRDETLRVFAERGGDPDRAGKRHPLDPLLWKRSLVGEPAWSTSFGDGRPGWHVECNVIAARLNNGATISLQGGGADLLFPHHYMTSIQAKAAFGWPFAKKFAHAGMVSYHGAKMSKSLGNLVFVSRLVDSGVDPMALRIALLLGHYRADREWSDDLLARAEGILIRLRSMLARQEIPDYTALMEEVSLALAHDLDTPSAFAAIEEFITRSETDTTGTRSPGALSRFFDALLGIAL